MPASLEYRVRLRPDAQQQRAGLSLRLRRVVNECLRELRRNPFGPDTIELDRNPNLFRRRIDGYRLIFFNQPGSRIIEVTRIAPRAIAYRGINPPSYPRR